MFREVIVGVDGRPGGRDAAELGAKLAALGGRVSLAHVYPDLRPAPVGVLAAEQQHALELLDRERAATGVDAEIVGVAAGSVGAGLHQLAEQRSADLIVVGSCSRGPVGRLMLGDDRQASLEGAPCAVAVAPAGYASHPAPIARIGVAYDGSPESRAALALARQIAAEHRSLVCALTVVSLPRYSYAAALAVDWSGVLEALERDARAELARLPDVEGRVVTGVAAEELAAWSAGVDLLIAGSRGYGPLRRVMFGSTSEALARNTACPLVVLRRGAEHHAIDAPQSQIPPRRRPAPLPG